MDEIKLSLDGLASGALSSRCAGCIKDTGVGCCKIEPLFTFFELGSLINQGFPEVVEELIYLPRDRIKVTVYGLQPLLSGGRCFYHTPAGCRLPGQARPIICNVFLCDQAEAGVNAGAEQVLKGARDALMQWRSSFNSHVRTQGVTISSLLEPCEQDILQEIALLFKDWLDRQDSYRKVMVFKTKS